MKKYIGHIIAIILLCSVPLVAQAAELISCPLGTAGQTCTVSMVSLPLTSPVTPTTIFSGVAMTEVADPATVVGSDYEYYWSGSFDTAKQYNIYCSCTGSDSVAWMYPMTVRESRVDAAVTTRAPEATALSNVTWTPLKASYLDGSILSRPTAVAIRSEMDANSWKLDRTALESTLTAMKGATFNTSTDSLEALRNRGDAAWITGNLNGANQITSTVYLTGTTTPIPDYAVSVYDSGNTVFLGKVITDASGIAVLDLDPGTYKIRGRKAGYTPVNATETLVVTVDSTATYYADAYVISAPVAANACRVYEWAFMPDDVTPMTTVVATATIVTLPYDYNGKLHAGSEINATYDPVTGLLYWDLVYGASVKFVIEDLYSQPKTKTIPATSTRRLSSL